MPRGPCKLRRRARTAASTDDPHSIEIGANNHILRLLFEILVEEIVMVVPKMPQGTTPWVVLEEQLLRAARAAGSAVLAGSGLRIVPGLFVQKPSDLVLGERVGLLIITIYDIVQEMLFFLAVELFGVWELCSAPAANERPHTSAA